MLSHKIDTVVIGGGQAGLAISYYLNQEGREHVVLERAPAVANAWRNQRWDSFTLVTPNFQVRMPGAEYRGTDPYGFMPLAEVVEYFDGYVERFHLPVHCGVEVFSVEKMGEEYLVRTSEGDFEAANVVIATGLYQAPKIPKLSLRIPSNILQMHSMDYKNPPSLPDGAVLVVGTGQSGAQIAEERYHNTIVCKLMKVEAFAAVLARNLGIRRELGLWRFQFFDSGVEIADLRKPFIDVLFCSATCGMRTTVTSSSHPT